VTKYLELQQAQYVGDFSETIDVPITTGGDSFMLPQVTDELQKSDIIGVAFLVGDGTQRSIVANQLLLTAAQTSSAMFEITAQNRKKTNIPLRLFNMEGKPMVYLPINIKSINAKQSRIVFPVNTTFAGVIQLVFFTAQ
jgi:hypothetical protein